METKKSSLPKEAPPTMSFGQYLKQARRARGLSLNDVGRKLGFKSGTFVWNWEKNISMPPLKYIRRIAQVYKINEKAVRQEAARVEIRRIRMKYGV